MRIFIVEDDVVFANALKNALLSLDYLEIFVFNSGKECIQNLEIYRPEIITLDYLLTDMVGTDVLREIRKVLPDSYVIAISGQDEPEVVSELLKNGAYDYISKKTDAVIRLQNSVKNLISRIFLVQENQRLEEMTEFHNRLENLTGNSPAMRNIFRQADRVSKTNVSVSLLGAIGTGKETLAKAIHLETPSVKGKFIALSPGAYTKENFDNALWGYSKDSFGSPNSNQPGAFELAANGTLYISEITEVPLTTQVALLRALQEKHFSRVNSDKMIPITCRVIIGSSKDLLKCRELGTLREELYYQIMGLVIKIPQLSDRNDDILLLARHFVNQYTESNLLSGITISLDAQKALLRYTWPGNLRELRSVIERACVACSENIITANDLGLNAVNPLAEFLQEDLTLDQIKTKVIFHYLTKYDNDIPKVSEILDIGQATVYRMLNRSNFTLSNTTNVKPRKNSIFNRFKQDSEDTNESLLKELEAE